MTNPRPKKYTRPFHAPRAIPTPAHLSNRANQALLPFGLLPQHTTSPHLHTPLPTLLLNQLTSAKLTLITGHSGSGKSTLLRALQHSFSNTITANDLPTPDPTKPIVNLFNTPLNQTLQLLSQVGLAQPNLWSLPAQALSTGEQSRLQLARLIDAAPPYSTILIDELATPLDRLTARSLGASINKLIKHTPSIKIIAAAAHEDLPTYLNTNLLINADDLSILPNQYTPETITYEPGTIDDYHALKHHHYLGADPASIARIDRAMRTCPVTYTRILAGVLVVAYPTLNASWRDRAWPGRYTTACKSTNAKRVNAELRRLSRIIIDPRSRSLSIASTLVRNYLANPLTPATEALAAMGSVSPFLHAAGMTEYPVPQAPNDLRLLDCLHHLDLTPNDLLRKHAFDPLLQRELKTWARTKNIDPNHDSLPHFAAFKLLTQPRAYTHATQEQCA
jgi:ABC-type transport system involved in cytochrome c biogenesis ATPase subunit